MIEFHNHDQLLALVRLMPDDELRVGLVVTVQRRNELVSAEQPWLAEQFSRIACVLAQVRDERWKLRLEVDAAANPFSVAMIDRPDDDG